LQSRTAKRVVPFLGNYDGTSGRWTFRLNPALGWSDLSADTRQRLRHLPAEAQQAFAAKYPARPLQSWRDKSQKYKPPHSSKAHLVLLEDLVLSLHAVYMQHEGGKRTEASIVAPSSSGGSTSTAAVATPTACELASCGTSVLRLS
jgi:hypothetical protein